MNSIIKCKVGLLNLAEELGDACKVMGVSRDIFIDIIVVFCSRSRSTSHTRNM